MTPSAPTYPVTYGTDASIAKFSVSRYQRMIETGILTADDQVELLDNYVVLKTPHNPPHDNSIDRITEMLYALKPAGWRLRIQSAISLTSSQPEPDLVFARGSPADFKGRHPGASEVGLIIEVADSSLPRDQRDKARIYASAGIPIYWIVNLIDGRVEVFGSPIGSAYADQQTYQVGDLVPVVLDGSVLGSIAVADMLP